MKSGLSIFDGAAVIQICGDPGGPKGMARDFGRQTRCSGPAFHHSQRVVPSHPAFRDPALPINCSEEGRLLAVGDPNSFQVEIEILVGVMVSRNLVPLAAFFVETKPPAFPFCVKVIDFHSDGRADACKRVNHDADQRSIPQSDGRRDIDRIK
jgi:hypothetical protein